MVSKHYPQFLKEYKNHELVENEWCFVTYKKIPKDKIVEIGDLYTVPEARKSNKASSLVKSLENQWKEEGYVYMYTHIYNSYHGKETSLLASLKYGMKIIGVDNIKITLGKEL